MKIAILQPTIPFYREDFFNNLKKILSVDIYTYKKSDIVRKEHTKISSIKHIEVSNLYWKTFLLYNPFPFLSKKNHYDILVLMLNKTHITTWILLLTKFLHRKKIIVWGQGISVKRYLKEENKPDILLKMQMKLADGVWLYMDKEYKQWTNILKSKPIVALNNTITGINEILKYKGNKNYFKNKYKIKENVIFIFCARFESSYRRTDLLLEIIKRLDSNKYGFIIIGDGKNKPDFTPYNNVYDFGTVYDVTKKQELFTVADLYLQPGWVGLSVVEAMAYGLPICTFIRSEETKQCVEYSYIVDGVNGLIFRNIEDCIYRISSLSNEAILNMGKESFKKASMLTPEKMSENAISVIREIMK